MWSGLTIDPESLRFASDASRRTRATHRRARLGGVLAIACSPSAASSAGLRPLGFAQPVQQLGMGGLQALNPSVVGGEGGFLAARRRSNCRCHADPPSWTAPTGGGPAAWAARPSPGCSPTSSTRPTGASLTTSAGHALLAELDALGLAVLEADPRYGKRRPRGPTAPPKAVGKPRSRRRHLAVTAPEASRPSGQTLTRRPTSRVGRRLHSRQEAPAVRRG